MFIKGTSKSYSFESNGSIKRTFNESELKKLFTSYEKDFYRQLVRTYAEYDEIYKYIKWLI